MKLEPPRGLAGRMTIAFVGTIVVAMVVMAALVPRVARAHQLAALEDRLADEAELVADHVSTELDKGHDANIDVLAKRLGQRSQTRITIIAPDGTVLGESDQDLSQVGNHASRAEVQQALAGVRGVDLHYSATVGYEMLYVAVPIIRAGSVVGIARTALPLTEVNRSIADLTRAILLAGLGSGLLAIIVAAFATRAITRPLARLAKFATDLSNDPLRSRRVWLGGGPREILKLGETLERMAAAVRESLQRVGIERDRLDAVLANLADGVVIVDSHGRVTRLNAAAEHLLRPGTRAAAGSTDAEVLRDHELIELVERVRTEGSGSPVATTFLEWPSPRRWLRAAASRYGTGEASLILLVLQDLTELRRLETVRRDFVANVSHELRTPIAAIKAMAETLQDGAIDDSAAAHDFVTRIEREVDGMHRLVEELLELSRLESDRVEVVLTAVEPAQLVNRAAHLLEPMAARANISLNVVMPGHLPAVMADAERMHQVMMNLIHNAIKFTPAGGRIDVRAMAEEERVVFSVADTGIGIAPELLSRVFERFYKTDQARTGGGTGLGLAIAKHTVHLHRGGIWAESEGLGQGTTIKVSLCRAVDGQAE